MSETPTIRALIDLEDAGPGSLFTKVLNSDAYLWPLARWPIASKLSSIHLNVTPQSAIREPGRLYYLNRAIRGLIPNPRSTDWLRPEIEHLFIVLGGTQTSAPRGVGNWLTDAFAQALGDRAAVVQDKEFDLFTSRMNRPANSRTWTEAPATARIRRRAKASPLSSVEQEHVFRFLEDVYLHFGGLLPSEARESITQIVLNRVRRLRHIEEESSALLERLRPRHIYMEEAAYGGSSSLIRTAHERGIKVAELQHGWIGASHAAYNYGRAWFDSPLTSSLPDTLITFGSYWGEKLRFPGKIVPVGKPHLEQMSALTKPYPERRHRLLMVSSVFARERLIAGTILLRRLLPDSWEIAIRPHPSERADAETLFAAALGDGVSIDHELDVNASVASSRAVVGMVSTVLFEALPLGVHIGVIETDLAEHYADARIFPKRLDEEASFSKFVQTLISGEVPDSEAAHTIWHSDAVDTFLEEFASA